MSPVTLVTVTYDSTRDLRRHWSGWDPAVADWVVVDNASRDGSADLARQLGASHVVELERNLGFSRANNVALREIGAGLVGCVNPDVTITAACVETLRRHVASFGGLAAPQLISRDGTLQPNGRGRPSPWAKLRNRVREHNPDYHLLAGAGECRAVDWVMGAAVFGDRATWARLRGWDERYFVYYEDADLGLRARAAGLDVTVCGSARAVHGWARATSRLSLPAWRRELRSAATFYGRRPGLLVPLPGNGNRGEGVRACGHR